MQLHPPSSSHLLMLFSGSFQLHYIAADRNYIILLELQIESSHRVMFYHPLPFILPLPTALPAPPHFLRTLAHALSQSIQKYQQSLALKNQHRGEEESLRQRQLGERKQSLASEPPASSQLSSKLPEKISENESSKIVPECVANPTIPESAADDSASQTEEELRNIALIPNFGLTRQQRGDKRDSLLSRRVWQWKRQKARRRERRVAYNWL